MNRLFELQKNKQEAVSELLNLESHLGHYIFTKKDKTIDKNLLSEYTHFNAEVDVFRDLQSNIRALDSEQKELKAKITEMKALQINLKKEVKSMYLEIGKALFDKYTPAISDIFGKTYTQICIEQRKISEAKEKEALYRKDDENNGIFSRLVNQAKRGAVKAQVAAFEQKRVQLYEQGAKIFVESGKIPELVKSDFFDKTVRKLLEDFNKKHQDLSAVERNLENLTLNDGAVKSSLEKAGVSSTVKKRLIAIDVLIEQKLLEQDDFCSKHGHDYVSRYVSPDAEILVDLPKGLDKKLLEIQDCKRKVLSITRQIDIENMLQSIEKAQKQQELMEKEKESNMLKISKLESENVSILERIKEKVKEENNLKKRIEELIKEEQKR